LRAEGDALSRKQSEVEASMRKLRAALKESESQSDQLRVRVEQLEAEARTGHLMAQASTEEVLQTQTELEKEAADREAALQLTVASHAARLSSLQAMLVAVEVRVAAREDTLRAEITSLGRRCQDAEAARDELAASNTEATMPLLRELEAAKTAVARASDALADTEARLLGRVQVQTHACHAACAKRHTRSCVLLARAGGGSSAHHRRVCGALCARARDRCRDCLARCCSALCRAGRAARICNLQVRKVMWGFAVWRADPVVAWHAG
jgi:hypothetical protein